MLHFVQLLGSDEEDEENDKPRQDSTRAKPVMGFSRAKRAASAAVIKEDPQVRIYKF